MEKRLSRRAREIPPSQTLRLARRAQELRTAGRDVISLGLGEPDFDTPAPAREAAKRAIDAGHTHYTANEGIAELRAAIASKFAREEGVRYEPDGEILCTAGAKQAVAHALLALVDPGDEVIVPRPYWLTYPEQVRIAGGVAKFIDTRAEEGFVPTAESVDEAVTPRTRALVVNSPHNPTGAVWDASALRALGEAAARHGLFVVSDEIYAPLVYDGKEAPSFVRACPSLRDRTVVCRGMSKAYAMTGWRLGYALGPRDVVAAMSRIQSHTTSNPNSIAQYAALAALEECDDDIRRMREAFAARRRLVLERLGVIDALSAPTPHGAFYVFVDVSKTLGRTSPAGRTLEDDEGFCEALLEEASVSLVPGAAFGAPGFARLSYAASEETLAQALDRIEGFVRELK